MTLCMVMGVADSGVTRGYNDTRSSTEITALGAFARIYLARSL